MNTVASPARVELRTMSFDDYEGIAAVQAANGLNIKPRGQWLNLWQGNPSYHRLHGWPIGWVLEDRGRIVGALENVPCLYRLHGSTLVGACGRGWAADPPYRALAFSLITSQLRQSNVDLVLTNTASPRTASLLATYGFEQVPAGRWDKSAVWVTSHVRTVTRLLEAHVPGFVSTCAAPLLYPPLYLADVLQHRRYPPGARFDLEWLSGFDERFEKLWQELEFYGRGVLLAARDLDSLRWHFREALEGGRVWILGARLDGELAGYAVFEKRDVQRFNLARALLIDLQTSPAGRDAIPAMFAFAWRRCREEQVGVMENVGCWIEDRLGRSALYHRSLGACCYLYRARHESLAKSLQRPEAWHPTQYDGDASL